MLPSAPSLRVLVLSLLAAVAAAGCKREQAPAHPDGYETLTIRYEGSAGTVGIVELAEDLGYFAPVKLPYVGNNASGGPHSIQAVATDDVDVGAAFNGSIVKLIASRAPIQAVVAAYGIDEKVFLGFYTLEDSPVRSARDLIGKKVAINTLGAHAEFVLREYLAREGLSREEAAQVTMVALPSVNAELALREGQVDAVGFGSTLRDRALERGGIRMLFSDVSLLGPFTAGSYVMSKSFLAKHPKTARKFVEGIGRAFDWANAQPREAVIARMEAMIRKRKRNEDTSVVRNWAGTSVKVSRGALKDEDFQRWIDWLERDGQLRREQIAPKDVYTNAFQPAGSLATR